VRRAAKAVLRGYGVATSPLRRSPDFLIIGAKRGGTTSMFNYIAGHPRVAPLFPGRQHIKGVHYFDTGFERGPAWYRSHFPMTGRGRSVVGEGSPYYLGHPHAARRAVAAVPNAKLIVLLRHPVDRAYSHYLERVRNRAEDLSFEEALDREPERLAGEIERMRADASYVSWEHEHHGYVAQSRYDELLPAWLDRFDRDRFLILRSEDLYRDPAGVCEAAFRFLGLPPHTPESFPAFNLHPKEPMAEATRRRLLATLEPTAVRVEELLGMTFPEWRR
jgi:hypothetical protein